MDYRDLKIDYVKTFHCSTKHYTEPTINFTINSPPWTTANMLDFIRYNFYLDIPFLVFHNTKISDRNTQAFLENDTVEENILSRSHIPIWYLPYMPCIRDFYLWHSPHTWMYYHKKYMGSFARCNCWSIYIFVVSIYVLTSMLDSFHGFNTDHTNVSMQTFPNGGPLIRKAIFFCRTFSEGLTLRNTNTRAKWVSLIISLMVKYKYDTHHNYFKLAAWCEK